MRVVVLILLVLVSQSGVCEEYRNKLDRRSMIDLNRVSVDKWLDFKSWKEGRANRDVTPKWKRVVRDLDRKEWFGKVLSCKGECIVHRDDGTFHASYRTKIFELDEIETMENSYAWIFLLDGTMVRLSPKSSLTMKEFNVGRDSFFSYARLNYGNLFWLARNWQELTEINKRETDSVFLPLEMSEANPRIKDIKVDEKNLMYLVDDPDKFVKRYRELNSLIKVNNLAMEQKNSIAYIVTPEGAIWGDQLQVDLYSLWGNVSYFRSRTTMYYKGNSGGDYVSKAFVYSNFQTEKEPVRLEENSWYEIKRGSPNVESCSNCTTELAISTFPTQRIPSILIGRETWIARFTSQLNDRTITEKDLAIKFGHRLWGKSSSVHSDFVRRILFLKRHSKRDELNINKAYVSLEETLQKRGEKISGKMEFGSHFYAQALNRYLNPRKAAPFVDDKGNASNSTKKVYWRMIHEDESLLYPRFGQPKP